MMEADHWVPDHERAACVGCAVRFSFSLRRHHCRECGDVFCISCAPAPAANRQRLCRPCKRDGGQPVTIARVATLEAEAEAASAAKAEAESQLAAAQAEGAALREELRAKAAESEAKLAEAEAKLAEA